MSHLITTIEFNDRECRLLQIMSHREKLQVKNTLHVTFPLASDKSEEEKTRLKAAALKEALKAEQIKPVNATLVVPKSLVTARTVNLPSTEDRELNQMARFEAERHIPFNVERYIISHHVLRKEGISGSKVLLTAVDSLVIEEILRILTQAGIEPKVADVSTVALTNCFLFQEAEAKQQAEKPLSSALINIGSVATDIVVVEDSIPLFARTAPVGIEKMINDLSRALGLSATDINLEELDALEPENSLASLGMVAQQKGTSKIPAHDKSASQPDQPGVEIISSEGEKSSTAIEVRSIVGEWLEKMVTEIKRTYSFARREFECPAVNKIFISGAGATLKNIEHYLRVNLGVEIQRLNPFGKLQMPDKTTPEPLISYCICLGALTREILPETVKINILPYSYIQQKQTREKRASILVTGVLALSVLVIGLFYVSDQVHHRTELIKWYSEQNSALKPIVSRLQDMEDKYYIIRKNIRDPRSALAILNEISKMNFLPFQVAITDFQYIKGKYLEVSGHARSIPDLNIFITSLEKTDFFDRVELKQRESKALPGRSPKVYSFTINCSFAKKRE